MSYAPQSQPGYPPPAQQDFPPNPYSSQQPPSGNQGCGWTTCLIGCFGMLMFSMLACGLGGWWLYQNTNRLIADAARAMATGVVNELEIPAEEKTEIIAQIDRVADAYRQGKITADDMQKMLQSIAESPLLPLVVVFGIEEKYLKPSGLTEEEKTDARLTLQRLVRGGFEKKISDQEIQTLVDDISYTNANGQRQMHDQLTDEQLKAFLMKAEKLVDDKNIPAEEFKVDISDEIKKAVDEGLKRKGL